MAIRKHEVKYSETDLFFFDSTAKHTPIPETTLTTTQGATFHYCNPSYSCRCRRGYTLTSDVFNIWKLQETPDDNSRGDIFKSYRLIGGGF
jgi:hypothetical protein